MGPRIPTAHGGRGSRVGGDGRESRNGKRNLRFHSGPEAPVVAGFSSQAPSAARRVIFIDTSAIVKAYVTEQGSPTIKNVVARLRGRLYLTPAVVLEVLGALAKHRR